MRFTGRQIFYIAITVATLTLVGFVGRRGWIFWENQRVEEWVQSYGGFVDWEHTGHRTPKWIEEWAGEHIFDDIDCISIDGSAAITLDEIESLARLRHLSVLGMGVTTFGDDHAKVLSKSKSIEGLLLNETEISDEGLAHIAGTMPQLNLLGLKRSQITGKGLSHLRKMPNLEQLWLQDSSITDADLSGLRGTNGLIQLTVGHGITDEGIREIVQLKSLERVSFTLSSVTDAGIDLLIAGLPNLKEITLEATDVTNKKIAEIEKSGIRVSDSL